MPIGDAGDAWKGCCQVAVRIDECPSSYVGGLSIKQPDALVISRSWV